MSEPVIVLDDRWALGAGTFVILLNDCAATLDAIHDRAGGIAAFEMSRKRTQPLWENDTCQDCKCPPEECECDKCTYCGYPYPCKCVAAEVNRND